MCPTPATYDVRAHALTTRKMGGLLSSIGNAVWGPDPATPEDRAAVAALNEARAREGNWEASISHIAGLEGCLAQERARFKEDLEYMLKHIKPKTSTLAAALKLKSMEEVLDGTVGELFDELEKLIPYLKWDVVERIAMTKRRVCLYMEDDKLLAECKIKLYREMSNPNLDANDNVVFAQCVTCPDEVVALNATQTYDK